MLLSGTLLNSDVEYGEVDAEFGLRVDDDCPEAYRTGRILEIGSDLGNAEILNEAEIEQGRGLSLTVLRDLHSPFAHSVAWYRVVFEEERVPRQR